jgi:hypothetical protein
LFYQTTSTNNDADNRNNKIAVRPQTKIKLVSDLNTKTRTTFPKSLRIPSKTPNPSRINTLATVTTTSNCYDKIIAILLSLVHREKDIGHHIDWTLLSHCLLITESILIQVFQPELNRKNHPAALLIYSTVLPWNILPAPNG